MNATSLPSMADEARDDAIRDEELAELRELLLGAEIRDLRGLRRKLDDPGEWLRQVSAQLPQAVALRGAQDDQLANAIQPTVDKSLRASVRRDPRMLVEAISPIMGPAIRRAVVSTLKNMVRSLNDMLAQAVSLRGLRWRIHAWRTGKPFAEVVLLNTLLYRVEQIVLIHRETGIVLHQVVHDDVAEALPDSDLVSAMLSAIQRFVEDAFSSPGEALDTVEMGGDHALWIEQGVHMVLAGLVRGTPPITLRSQLQDALDEIEASNASILDRFDGNADPFDAVHNELASCLVMEVRRPRSQTAASPAFLIASAAATMAVLGLSWWVWGDAHAWRRLLDELDTAPGIVVTESGGRPGRHHVGGLRDPLAADPSLLVARAGFEPDQVDFRWRLFRSDEPALVVARARAALDAPPGIDVEIDGGTLVLRGSAPADWYDRVRASAAIVAGLTGLEISVPESAPRALLHERAVALEEHIVYSVWGSSDLLPGQENELNALVTALGALRVAQAEAQVPLQVMLLGHADASGSEQFNRQLSQERADLVLREIERRGAPRDGLLALGVGVAPNADVGDAAAGPSPDRSVTIRVLAPASTGVRKP